MTHAKNALFLFAVFGLGFSSPVPAQLLGEYGGETIELRGATGRSLGSVISANLQRQWRNYKEVSAFKGTDKKGRVTIITDPKRIEIEPLMRFSFDLVKEKKYDEALVKLQELERAEGKAPEDDFYVHRMRVSIASTTGNDPLLVKSLEAAVATGQASDEEQLLFIRVLSYLYANQMDLPRTIAWTSRYLKDAGNDAEMHTRLIRAYYLNNEYAAAARELWVNIAEDEAAGKTPELQDIRLLASAELKAGNRPGFNDAIEKSLVYFPRKEDWAELLDSILAKPRFDDGLALEVYRLMFRTEQFTAASDFMNMARWTLQLGFPTEARQVLVHGSKSGLFDKGIDAASHRKLLDVVTKRIARKSKMLAKDEADALKARDGDALVHIGYSYVTEDQFDKGIKLIEQGIAMGGLKRPEHARLRLGMALGTAGRTAEATQTLKAVRGTDGAAELARYWAILFAKPHA